MPRSITCGAPIDQSVARFFPSPKSPESPPTARDSTRTGPFGGQELLTGKALCRNRFIQEHASKNKDRAQSYAMRRRVHSRVGEVSNGTCPAAAIVPAPRACASQAARRDGAEALLFDVPLTEVSQPKIARRRRCASTVPSTPRPKSASVPGSGTEAGVPALLEPGGDADRSLSSSRSLSP